MGTAFRGLGCLVTRDGPLGPDGTPIYIPPLTVSEEHFMGNLLSLLNFLQHDAGPLEEAHDIFGGDAPDLERARRTDCCAPYFLGN